jgi:hypothetical protein
VQDFLHSLVKPGHWPIFGCRWLYNYMRMVAELQHRLNGRYQKNTNPGSI